MTVHQLPTTYDPGAEPEPGPRPRISVDAWTLYDLLGIVEGGPRVIVTRDPLTDRHVVALVVDDTPHTEPTARSLVHKYDDLVDDLLAEIGSSRRSCSCHDDEGGAS